MLLAQLMMRQGRYDDAIAALSSLARRSRLDRLRAVQLWAWPWYAEAGCRRHPAISTGWARMRDPQRGVAGAQRQGQSGAGIRAAAGKRPPRPNLSWSAFVSRVPSRPRRCWESAGRTPEWANSSGRWYPWLTLRKRSLLDSAVQESFLTVPYAYSPVVQRRGQAAEYYNTAIRFLRCRAQAASTIRSRSIRSGRLLDRLLNDDKKDTLTWYWQLTTLPNAPESRYLYALLASNEFQEGLKNYRELNFMSRNLDNWRDDVSAYDDMLDTRQEAYNGTRTEGRRRHWPRRIWTALPKSASISNPASTRSRNRTTSRPWVRRRSKQTWPRLKSIEDYLAAHPDDPDLAEMREKHPADEGRHVLEAVGELQSQALERTSFRQGTRGRTERNPEAGGAREPSAGRSALDHYRRLRMARRGHPCPHGSIASAPGRCFGTAESIFCSRSPSANSRARSNASRPTRSRHAMNWRRFTTVPRTVLRSAGKGAH